MDENKFAKKSIKIIGSTGVVHSVEFYVDPDYEFKTYSNTNGSKTGHLVFAELKPYNSFLPTFKLRWDHGDEVVDVDIFYNNEPHNALWNIEGYKGHHADQIDEGRREYSFLIEIPQRKIFEGTIAVGLLIGLSVEPASFTMIGQNVEIKVIRGKTNRIAPTTQVR